MRKYLILSRFVSIRGFLLRKETLAACRRQNDFESGFTCKLGLLKYQNIAYPAYTIKTRVLRQLSIRQIISRSELLRACMFLHELLELMSSHTLLSITILQEANHKFVGEKIWRNKEFV